MEWILVLVGILTIIGVAIAGFGYSEAQETNGREGPGTMFVAWVIIIISNVIMAFGAGSEMRDIHFEKAITLNYAHKCITPNEDVIYEWGPGVTDSTSMAKCKEVK